MFGLTTTCLRCVQGLLSRDEGTFVGSHGRGMSTASVVTGETCLPRPVVLGRDRDLRGRDSDDRPCGFSHYLYRQGVKSLTVALWVRTDVLLPTCVCRRLRSRLTCTRVHDSRLSLGPRCRLGINVGEDARDRPPVSKVPSTRGPGYRLSKYLSTVPKRKAGVSLSVCSYGSGPSTPYRHSPRV